MAICQSIHIATNGILFFFFGLNGLSCGQDGYSPTQVFLVSEHLATIAIQACMWLSLPGLVPGTYWVHITALCLLGPCGLGWLGSSIWCSRVRRFLLPACSVLLHTAQSRPAGLLSTLLDQSLACAPEHPWPAHPLQPGDRMEEEGACWHHGAGASSRGFQTWLQSEPAEGLSINYIYCSLCNLYF